MSRFTDCRFQEAIDRGLDTWEHDPEYIKVAIDSGAVMRQANGPLGVDRESTADHAAQAISKLADERCTGPCNGGTGPCFLEDMGVALIIRSFLGEVPRIERRH
jgi:hypothetical protein